MEKQGTRFSISDDMKGDYIKKIANKLAETNPINMSIASDYAMRVMQDIEDNKMTMMFANCSDSERELIIDLFLPKYNSEIKQAQAQAMLIHSWAKGMTETFSRVRETVENMAHEWGKLFDSVESLPIDDKSVNAMDFLEKKQAKNYDKSLENNKKAGRKHEKRFY